MLTNHPKSSNHPNIFELTHDLPHVRMEKRNFFTSTKDSTRGFRYFGPTLLNMARDMYKVPVVKELYKRRKEFDLIMVNHMFNEVRISFAPIYVKVSYNEQVITDEILQLPVIVSPLLGSSPVNVTPSQSFSTVFYFSRRVEGRDGRERW